MPHDVLLTPWSADGEILRIEGAHPPICNRCSGIVSFSRHTEVVPYGFKCPVRRTLNELPTCPKGKHDAVPMHVLEMLTRHHWLTGQTEDALEEYKSYTREISPFQVTCKMDALALASPAASFKR